MTGPPAGLTDPPSRSASAAPIRVAAHYGHVGMVRKLIEGGADVNVSCGGTSSLIVAAKQGFVDVCAALVANDADLFEVDEDEMTGAFRSAECECEREYGSTG